MSLIITIEDVPFISLCILLAILIYWLWTDRKERQGRLPLLGKKNLGSLFLAL